MHFNIGPLRMADELSDTAPATGGKRPLSPAAKRALAEAEARRREIDAAAAAAGPKEIGGRGGAEPARFGDWEVKGRAIDF